MPSGSSPRAWAPPPWRSRPTTWPWSPTQMRCCSSSRRPPRRCRPQPESPSIDPLPTRRTQGRSIMTNVVVIGGTGLIGSKVVARLAEHGHEAVAASPNSGVNTLAGAQVVVDVSNSPSFEDKAALEFFTTSTGNLLAAEQTAGVGHHVALSVVGTERLVESGYMRAKLAPEQLIRESGIRHLLFDRACDPVLRARQEHCRRGHRRQHGSPLARAHPTHRGGRGRWHGCTDRCWRADQRHHRDRRSRAV